MPKARLALTAAVMIALVCMPFVFLAKPSPHIELHFLKALPIAEGVIVAFQIRNAPPSFHSIAPLKLEAIDGTTWKELPGGFGAWTQIEETNVVFCCTIDRKAQPKRLRLVTQYQRTLNPFERFITLVKLRLSGKNNRVPLNPFNKSVALFSDPMEVTSEEFAPP
jgi:hypothetical protein